MIRLDLTLQQADWLKQHLLDPALATAAQRASLLSQLAQAYEHATAILTCPVCNASFNRLRRGRAARFCSPACKQKAYRQRRNAWRRHHPMPQSSD